MAKTNANAKNNTSTVPSKQTVRKLIKEAFEATKEFAGEYPQDRERADQDHKRVLAYIRHLEKQAGL